MLSLVDGVSTFGALVDTSGLEGGRATAILERLLSLGLVTSVAAASDGSESVETVVSEPPPVSQSALKVDIISEELSRSIVRKFNEIRFLSPTQYFELDTVFDLSDVRRRYVELSQTFDPALYSEKTWGKLWSRVRAITEHLLTCCDQLVSQCERPTTPSSEPVEMATQMPSTPPKHTIQPQTVTEEPSRRAKVGDAGSARAKKSIASRNRITYDKLKGNRDDKAPQAAFWQRAKKRRSVDLEDNVHPEATEKKSEARLGWSGQLKEIDREGLMWLGAGSAFHLNDSQECAQIILRQAVLRLVHYPELMAVAKKLSNDVFEPSSTEHATSDKK